MLVSRSLLSHFDDGDGSAHCGRAITVVEAHASCSEVFARRYFVTSLLFGPKPVVLGGDGTATDTFAHARCILRSPSHSLVPVPVHARRSTSLVPAGREDRRPSCRAAGSSRRTHIGPLGLLTESQRLDYSPRKQYITKAAAGHAPDTTPTAPTGVVGACFETMIHRIARTKRGTARGADAPAQDAGVSLPPRSSPGRRSRAVRHDEVPSRRDGPLGVWRS